MKHRHFTQAARRLTALTLALLLALPSAYAAAGSPQLRTTRELADGLTYSNTITSHSAAGRVESFSLELSPDSREVEPIFLQASGTAYGAGSINLAVSYAQSLGYHVLGAINTDFFAPSTGVPLGISIEDGIYKSSPEAEAAVVITDGEVELVEQPQVTLTLTNESTGGQTVLTHLNKYRADSGGLYLFNYDFSTVSTHTSTPGWMVRMELTDPDDTLSVSGRLELEVTELLRTDTSVVIGENEYILTAADAGGLESVFQSFQVGDRVTLRTDCTSSTLEDAQWASGVGDVMVRDGQITDSTAWTYVEKGRDPRSALAAISANWFGHPAEELTIIGVTGTNGKTTTTYLLKAMLEEAVLRWDGPAAVRYPRGGEGEYREDSGRAPAAVLRRGSHITLVSYGVEINDVLQAAQLLEERGVEAEVVKLNIITPLDAAPVLDSVRRTGALLVAEDSVSAGSVGERLACALEQAGISARVALCSSGDTFTPHGSVGELKRLLELDGAGLAQRAMEVLRFDKTAAGC